MFHNIKYISQIRRKAMLLFSLLLFSGIVGSCSLRFLNVSPEGTWEYPGGGGPSMSITFHPGGVLSFTGGFDNLNPAKWQFDEQTKKLKIKVSNYDKTPTECGNLYSDEYACLRYNPKTDMFECTLSAKTESISFLGWNFFRK